MPVISTDSLYTPQQRESDGLKQLMDMYLSLVKVSSGYMRRHYLDSAYKIAAEIWRREKKWRG